MKLLCLNYETALGTAVHATPVFAALRTLRPDWEVHMACAGLTDSLFAQHPGIHKRYITSHPVTNTWTAATQFVRLSLQHKFDAVLLNAGNCRPRVAWNSRLVRAQTRIGVSTSRRFVDISLEPGSGSVALTNLSILKPLIPELNEDHFAESFELFFSQTSRDKAYAFRQTIAHDAQPVIGFVTQTSGGQPSTWWDDRFIEVAQKLNQLTGSRSVFFGTRKEAPQIDQICQSVGKNVISLAGETQLENIGAYCAVCDLLITLDTGTMHVGRAIGVPMVVIAPAWQPAHEWLPLNQDHIKVLRRWNIPCRHCRKFTCATHECMDEISVDEVVSAALSQLDNYAPIEQKRLERLNRSTITD